MAFDPDAYLSPSPSGGFDPDAYLKGSPAPVSKLESAGRGAMQGATAGFGDEITGADRATVQKLLDKIYGNDQGGSWLDEYRSNRDEVRANDAKARAANPKSFGAGEIAGGATSALIPGLGEANSVGKMAALGATQGLGNSEADLTKGDVGGAARDTAVGAGIGAGTGVVASKAADLAGKGLRAAGSGAGWLAKKAMSSLLGPSEEAIDALIADPSVRNASVEGVARGLPKVAGKFDDVIKGMNEKARGVLSTSRFLQPTESDPGGAFTKDEVLGAVQSARRGLGGVYTDESRTAAGTLGRVTENLAKIKNTVSQNQVHDLIQDLDSEIPWDKVWRAPETLSATDHALMDVRGKLDGLLKARNPEYEKMMKPVSDAIEGRNEFVRKFGIQRVKGEGYTPSDQAFNRTRGALNEGKIDTDRVIGNVKDLVGEDLGPEIEKARFGEEFRGGKTNGSRSVNQMSILGGSAGAGIGALAGGPVGAAVGGAVGSGAGAAVGSYVDKKGGEMAGDLIATYLKNKPQALGKYLPVFQRALAAGANGASELINRHFVLSHTDPEYRKMLDGLRTDGER